MLQGRLGGNSVLGVVNKDLLEEIKECTTEWGIGGDKFLKEGQSGLFGLLGRESRDGRDGAHGQRFHRTHVLAGSPGGIVVGIVDFASAEISCPVSGGKGNGGSKGN